jgi:hypothetical protein
MKVLAILFAAAVAILGLACCFWSKNLQAVAARALDIAAVPEPARLRTYVRSGTYLVHLRLVGAVCIAMSALLLYAVSKAR